MLELVLLAAGGLAFVVAAGLHHLQQWSISPPLLGLATGVVLGPEVLGALSLPAGDEIGIVRTASRLLLGVALMAIALRYPVSEMRRHVREVAVLLLVVLPTMAVVVAAGATWGLQMPLAAALVLGAALSPTDPVLASGIATGRLAERDIPERNRVVLSLESGANDGLALPFVALAIAFALGRSLPLEAGRAAYEVLGGIAVGAVAGVVASRGMQWARAHREVDESIRSLYTLVLAAFVIGLGGLLEVNELLGVFVAGLVHNRLVTGVDRKSELGIDDTLNHFLVLPVFLLLGAVLPWEDWQALGWRGVLFVLVALLLRRLPIMLALSRPLGETRAHAAWLGWFGPIGVAALFYLGHAHEGGVTDPRVWAAGTLVVAVSTVVHGLSAGPARALYRRTG